MKVTTTFIQRKVKTKKNIFTHNKDTIAKIYIRLRNRTLQIKRQNIPVQKA